MKEPINFRPLFLNRWEWWTLVGLVILLVFLAVEGKDRKGREAYARFLETAPKVQAALERFADGHDGRFPPDAMFYNGPEGLTGDYIKWDPTWKIDYEVHENGHDGNYVCLEFGGPFKERLYFGLCNNPEFRRKYGRGQPIPGQVNRIWLIREEAPIMEPPL